MVVTSYKIANGSAGKQYRITGELLRPKSNPKYYTDLVKELEEAPNRTFLGRMAKRLGGIIRFQS